MKITKIGSETTFVRETTTQEAVINGKDVRVYKYRYLDGNIGHEEFEIEIDEADEETLTEDEKDFLLDNMDALLDMEDGEEIIEEGRV